MKHLAVTLLILSWSTLARAQSPTLPPEDESGGMSRAQAVEVFMRDCRATLNATSWDFGEERSGPECLALDIDQNCNPDTFGCYGEYESCKVACQPGCTKCQDTCADTCDGCKAGCAAGDLACVRKCAEARADCRGRCIKGLKACQTGDCPTAERACMRKNVARLSECDAGACSDYVQCFETEEDWQQADKKCEPKIAGQSAFCKRVCTMERDIPTWYNPDDFAPEAAPLNDGESLAAQCTAEAQCPADYAALAPYLASFCTGVTSDASFEALSKDLARGAISKRTLSLVFNAYGAMHGYEFKKEKWMNGFFYGAGGDWLPDVCKAKMRSYASAKVMPLRYTKLRDRVKKLWNELK